MKVFTIGRWHIEIEPHRGFYYCCDYGKTYGREPWLHLDLGFIYFRVRTRFQAYQDYLDWRYDS